MNFVGCRIHQQLVFAPILNNATGTLLSWTAGDAEHQGHLPDPNQGSNWKSPLGSTGKSLC
jgi:hypothetical protein